MLRGKQDVAAIIRRTAIACAILTASSVLNIQVRAEDTQQKVADLGQCKLESGQVIEDCKVGYRTFGKLNGAADNAILMPTWLYGKSTRS